MKSNTHKLKAITRYLLTNSSEDKKMIDRIIQDDAHSRQEFEAYTDVWEKSANLKDYEKIDTEADWNLVKTRMKMRPRSKRIPMQSYFLRIAAILFLAAGLSYFLVRLVIYVSPEETVYTEISTTANLRVVTLPDGSNVSLNRASKIIHNSEFGKSNRDVILEGEAFFDVTSNEHLPFKIFSLNSTIEVLGTRFNVKTDTTCVTVGVLSGKVAMYQNENKKNRIELLSETTGIYNTGNNDFLVENYFDRNTIAWHTREFVFRNQPLLEVCSLLAGFYNLKLVAGNEIQFLDSVNATCNTEPLDGVLYIINSTLTENIKLVVKDDLLIVRKQ